MKKFFLAILPLLLLILWSEKIYAAEGPYTEGYYQYEIVDEGIIITGYFGSEKTVEVPAEIAGYPVSEIGEEAFLGSTVEELILPETIMKIGENALPSNCRVSYAGIPEANEQEGADNNGMGGSSEDAAEAELSEGGELSESEDVSDSDDLAESESPSIDEAEIELEEPVSESKGQEDALGKGSGKSGSSGEAAGADSTSAANEKNPEKTGIEKNGQNIALYFTAAVIIVGIIAVIVRRKKKGQ